MMKMQILKEISNKYSRSDVMNIYCFSPFGYEGNLVHIEVDLRRGIPAIDIVGLADGAVKESRERMRSAIRNSGLEFPPERVLISLSPADLKKEGAGFDLAVALAVLSAKDALEKKKSFAEEEINESVLVMGELELNGSTRGVRGIHAAVSTALSSGIRLCIVPEINADEARAVSGAKVFGAENLLEAYNAIYNTEAFTGSTSSSEKDSMRGISKDAVEIDGIFFPPVEEGFEFEEVHHQEKLIRGLQIAASGGHNVLAYGPPGCGKTMSMQKFPALLPYLSMDQSQSITRIFSIAGLMGADKSLLRKPPFRIPHQTASIEGMCGGGPNCLPGEISLAHNGVLFLDEAAEFRTSVLQMLRVPLESGSITLSRAGRTTVFPARFQLLLSSNPCPCGNYGSKTKLCLCSARAVEGYWKKFSAPLLDRIDIRIQVDLKENEKSNEAPQDFKKHSTNELRKKIASAIKKQMIRQGKKNVQLTPSEVTEFCRLEKDAENYLTDTCEKLDMSPRAYSGCLKLSRTIADMENSDRITMEALKEAVELRKPAVVF